MQDMTIFRIEQDTTWVLSFRITEADARAEAEDIVRDEFGTSVRTEWRPDPSFEGVSVLYRVDGGRLVATRYTVTAITVGGTFTPLVPATA